MKTIKEIQKEIDEIVKILDDDSKGNHDARGTKPLKSAKIKRYKNEILYKRQMILYLEHNPMETALRRDLGKFQMLLDRHNDGFRAWVEQQAPAAKKTKTVYDRVSDIKGIKSRVSTLRYLLA